MSESSEPVAGVDSHAASATAQRETRTVRAWLTLLVLACTLPALAAVALYIAFDYHRGREQLVLDSLATARALTAALDRELAGTRSGLLALASSPHLDSDDLARFHAQARAVERTQNVNNIVLIDAQARQVVNTLRSFGDPLPLERNAALLGVFQTREPVVTDLFVGPVMQRHLLAVGVPVLRDDSVKYVLAAGVWPDRLSRILTQQGLPQGWVAAILDSKGFIVARTRDPERYIGQLGSPALIVRLAQGSEGIVDSVALDGAMVVSVFSRSAQSRWSVAIGIPRSIFATELRGSLLGLIAATVLLLAMALSAAWYVGRRMVCSMHALVAPAIALGHGKPVVVLPLELHEANEVGQALNRTSARLQRAVDRSLHDPLTGLANRTLFEEFLHNQIALAQRTGTELGVMYLDLDGFKEVNDRYGHAAGDELLRWVAGRISVLLRESDLSARLGGDEFAVVLPATGEAGARLVAEKLLESMSTHPKHRATVSASIGIAVYPSSAISMEALLQHADRAMYAAKESGKRQVSVA
jgi:diguanylate cyclase (GGDEF)-like protein